MHQRIMLFSFFENIGITASPLCFKMKILFVKIIKNIVEILGTFKFAFVKCYT